MKPAPALLTIATLLPAGSIAAQTPSFISLERMDDHSRIGVQVGLHEYSSGFQEHLSPLRLEIYGQQLLAPRAVGLYFQLPVVRAIWNGSADHTAMQGVDLGTFAFVGDLNVVRLGVILPSAADTDVDVKANAASLYERLGDLASTVPQGVWLRGSLSRLQRLGALTLRLDAGVDVRLNDAGAAGGVYRGSDYEDYRVLGHVGAGLAVPAGRRLTAAAEMQNLVLFPGPVELGGELFHALTLGVRSQGRTQVHAGWVVPLDRAARGKLWLFTVGIQHAAATPPPPAASPSRP